MRDKQEVFTADEVCGILIEHGQHDDRFKLGETIRYSPSEVLGILTKQTNGDRIRSMTDEELADFFAKKEGCTVCSAHPAFCKVDCAPNILKWLKQEVQKDAES